MADLVLKIIPIIVSICALAVSLVSFRTSRADRVRLMRAEGNQLIGELRGTWRDLEIECEEMIRIQRRWDRLRRMALRNAAPDAPDAEWDADFAENMKSQARKLRSFEEKLQLDQVGHLRGNDPVDLEKTMNMVRDSLVQARNTLASVTRMTQRMRENVASLEKKIRERDGTA